MRIVWVDLETGGTDETVHQITQVAAVATTGLDEGLEELDSFEAKVTLSPGHYTDEALQVQGYTAERWAGAKPVPQVLRDFDLWLSPHGTQRRSKKGGLYVAAVMGAYNASFDATFLRASADRAGVWLHLATWTGGYLDVLQWAMVRDLQAGRAGGELSYKLANVCERFGAPFNADDAHDALVDTRGLINLARALNGGADATA